MAVTTTLKQRTKLGNARMNVVEVEITSETYATGGIEITSAKLGLGLPYVVVPAPAAGYIFEFDHDNNKLKAYVPTSVDIAAGSETAGADNTVVRASGTAIEISGSGDAVEVKNAGTELADGATLTATVRLLAIGI